MLGSPPTLFHSISHSSCSHFECPHLTDEVSVSKITCQDHPAKAKSLQCNVALPCFSLKQNLEDLLRKAAHIREAPAERSLCARHWFAGVPSPREGMLAVGGAVLSLQTVWNGFAKLQRNHNDASDNTEHKLKDQYQW